MHWVCFNIKEECADHSCCSNQQLDKELFTVNDIGEELVEGDADAPEAMAMHVYPYGLVRFFFERENENGIVDLQSVFLILDESDSEFRCPPDNLGRWESIAATDNSGSKEWVCQRQQ